jgi:hypothetical protein
MGGSDGGGGVPGCTTTCSAPGASTVCIMGIVHSFEDPSFVPPPTASYGLVVKIFDAVAFATNPNTPPAATVNIGDNGCFTADGVPRFSSGLAAIVTDDAPGHPENFIPTGVFVVLPPNQNVMSATAYFLIDGAFEGWGMEVGVGPTTFMSGGLWFGQYVDIAGRPIANVRPTRPGDDPPSQNIYCFNADRATLTNNDVTGPSGVCGISPDAIETHGGVCATGGCMCGGSPCSPTFTPTTGGTTVGAVMVQTFVAQ